MKMKLTASLLLLSVFSTAHAKVILTSGSWTADDTSDRRNPNGVCRIYTQTSPGFGNSTTYTLMISKAKNSPGPTDIQIIMADGKPAKNFTLTLKDETVLAFADGGPSATVKRQSSAWYIPQHTDKLFAQLEDRKDIRVKPADGSRDPRIEFSADGFKRVKEKLQEKCLNNQPVYDLAFEEVFFLKRDLINPAGITPEQVKELRNMVNAGYSVHLGINGTKADMAKLQAKFQTQLNERDYLVSRIDSLGNREIPSIISSGQQNDGLEGSSRGQLAQVNVTISQQQSSLSGAQAQLNTARAVIVPHEAEHGDRESRAVSARRIFTNASQRLSEIDNGVRNAEQSINQLSRDAGALQNQNSRLDNDLRYARQIHARADMDARNYRPSQERDRLLLSDPVYQGALRELPRLHSNVQIIENALADAKGKLLARQTELRVCQTRTSFIQSYADRIPAQERPERGPRYNPNRPHPEGDGHQTPTTPTQPTTPVPTTPTEPTPTTPAPDCASQQGAVDQAKQVVASLEVQLRDANSRHEEVDRRINQRASHAEGEVQRIHSELQARTEQAHREERRIEGQLSANIRRLEIIANVEIPQQQNIVNQLSNERPSVQSRYDQEGPNANRLESELAAFERRVGWDAKVEAVQNAESLVSQRSNDLNRSLSQKTALETQINRCQQERTRLATALVDAQNKKLQAENRLQQVLASLVPFDQEEARLEQQENDLKGQLMSQAEIFESKLP